MMGPKATHRTAQRERLDICKWLLDSYGAAGDRFLERIVMGDETWIHCFEPESKCQSKGLGTSGQ